MLKFLREVWPPAELRQEVEEPESDWSRRCSACRETRSFQAVKGNIKKVQQQKKRNAMAFHDGEAPKASQSCMVVSVYL